MTPGPRRVSIGDRLAYVDDCLPRIDRAAIEETMREDAELKSQIEAWQAQNEAIRAAFPDHAAKRAAGGWTVADWLLVPDLTRHNAKRGLEGGPAEAPSRLGGDSADQKPAAPPPAPHAAANRRGRAPLVGGLGAAAALWIGAALLFSGDGVEPFAKAATNAYRTYAEGRARPVEIATSDRDALSRWFGAQMTGPAPIPDLTAWGLALIGGRIVPGAYAPAAFMLYENTRHERFAIEAEGVDAPPETELAVDDSGGLLCASWSGAGHSFAIVGRASRPRLVELARLVREGPRK